MPVDRPRNTYPADDPPSPTLEEIASCEDFFALHRALQVYFKTRNWGDRYRDPFDSDTWYWLISPPRAGLLVELLGYTYNSVDFLLGKNRKRVATVGYYMIGRQNRYIESHVMLEILYYLFMNNSKISPDSKTFEDFKIDLIARLENLPIFSRDNLKHVEEVANASLEAEP